MPRIEKGLRTPTPLKLPSTLAGGLLQGWRDTPDRHALMDTCPSFTTSLTSSGPLRAAHSHDLHTEGQDESTSSYSSLPYVC